MNFQKLAAAFGATLVIGAASAPVKQAPNATVATSSNINCLVVSNRFGMRATNSKAKALAQQSLDFYLGRIDPAATRQQLASSLKQSRVSINGTNLPGLMNACVRQMGAEERLLQVAGQDSEKIK